jgi:DNA-binding response OmpR family regulator
MSTDRPKRILVVEDERAIAQAMALKLNHAGFEAKTALDGEAALDLLTSESFDLIILDLVMPKLDGFAVLRELQSRKNTTPVIVASNLNQEGEAELAKELGAAEYFIKSNTPIVDLVKRVENILK